MARVFVSHSSDDRALADEIHQWLVEDRHEVFLDAELADLPGELAQATPMVADDLEEVGWASARRP